MQQSLSASRGWSGSLRVPYQTQHLLIPLGIVLAMRLIPGHILAEHRAKSRAFAARSKPVYRVAAAFVVVVWISLATLTIYLVARL